MAIFLLCCGVVCGCGLLGAIRSEGLDVQGLLAMEQGEGEFLEGGHSGHAACNGEGSAHSHPSGLQREQHLLWRVCRGESGWSGRDGGAVPATLAARTIPCHYSGRRSRLGLARARVRGGRRRQYTVKDVLGGSFMDTMVSGMDKNRGAQVSTERRSRNRTTNSKDINVWICLLSL